MNWWLLLLVLICRGADLATTFLITPDLRWERNPIIRRLGWRWTLVLNVIACMIAPFFPTFAFVLSGFSILAALWNLRILMRLRQLDP
jgi:hypothetical protein